MSDDLVKCLRARANGSMHWITVERMATEAADRIEQLEAALHCISLGSQDSGATKEGLGREARKALEGKDG